MDTISCDVVRRVCAWCGKSMGQPTNQLRYRHPVTHGMCGACAHVLSSFRDISLHSLISRLSGPVMVVDELSGVVVAANEAAASMFGKNMEEMAGQRRGNVMECVHARESGGCGRTEHCTGCTVRRVMDGTTVPGEGEIEASAYPYRVPPDGIQTQPHLIRTR